MNAALVHAKHDRPDDAVGPRRAPAPLTVVGFRAGLRRAAPSERLVYWRGLLVSDRAPGSALDKRNAARLDRLATEVLAAAEAGLVHLVQQRLGAGVFAYLAVKASKRSHP